MVSSIVHLQTYLGWWSPMLNMFCRGWKCTNVAVISDFMDLPAMFDDQRVYSKPPEAWPESISVLKKKHEKPTPCKATACHWWLHIAAWCRDAGREAATRWIQMIVFSSFLHGIWWDMKCTCTDMFFFFNVHRCIYYSYVCEKCSINNGY